MYIEIVMEITKRRFPYKKHNNVTTYMQRFDWNWKYTYTKKNSIKVLPWIKTLYNFHTVQLW